LLASASMKARYWLAILLDTLIVAGAFFLLGPSQVCFGDPPQCRVTASLVIRWSAVVIGAIVLVVILALAAVDRRQDRTVRGPSQ
jgi:hypothetical protein